MDFGNRERFIAERWMRGGLLLLLWLAPPLALRAQGPDRSVPLKQNEHSNAPWGRETERTRNVDGELELRRFKKQAIQSIAIGGGMLADSPKAGIDRQFTEVSIGSGIPLGSFTHLLGVTPAIRVDWLDADLPLDVPEELYEFELQLFYRRKIRERLSCFAIVSPSIRSDLSTDEDALRLFALALLHWECLPHRLTVSAGAVSLGRADLPVLPAVGLSWTPSTRSRLDLQFPRSRWLCRVAKNGGESEIWSYLSAGLGGNTWAVTRRSGMTDELSLGDVRILAGLQRLVDGGGRCFLEAGVSLARELEYARAGTHIDLPNGFLLQGGWSY